MTPANKSRRLAVALLAGAIAVVFLVVAAPVYFVHWRYDNAIAERLRLIDGYKRIASARAEAVRQLEAVRALEPRKAFLRTGAAALSAAEAQEALRTMIEGNGGRLITMQAPTSKEEGRYRAVTVNVQMTANVFALRKILHAIETNTPNLFVDNLTVRTQVPPSFKPAPGQEPEMFVQLDITGYSVAGA